MENTDPNFNSYIIQPSVDFIQEFDADRWEKPKDEKAPFIESIEVVVQESGPSVAGAEQSGTERDKGPTRH